MASPRSLSAAVRAWHGSATCVDTFAASDVVKCALEPGAAAAAAESRKRERYAGLSDRYIFSPVAVETTGVLGKEAAKLLRDIGSRISAITKDARELPWLLQRISIAVIRGNSAAILATAPTSQHRPASSTSPEVAADTNAFFSDDRNVAYKFVVHLLSKASFAEHFASV